MQSAVMPHVAGCATLRTEERTHVVPRGERDTMSAPHAEEQGLTAASEAQLVGMALAGGRRAFGELVRRYQDAVYNLCYRLLGDPAEAEDAAQEVFLRVYRNLHRYDVTQRFSTWILTITSNHCIDRLRRRRFEWVPLDNVQRTLSSAKQSVEETVIRQEARDAVQRLLNALQPEDRLVLVLHYWYDLSYGEIAKVLGTSEGAVKTRAHRARQRLGALLAEEGWEP